MDDRFWHSVEIAMPSAWMTALLPDPSYAVVLAAGAVLGVILLSLRNLAASADDFLRCGMLLAWRAVVSAAVKYMILLAVRAAAMIAATIAARYAQLAARRLPPPPAAPRHLPSLALSPRLIPVPVLGRA